MKTFVASAVSGILMVIIFLTFDRNNACSYYFPELYDGKDTAVYNNVSLINIKNCSIQRVDSILHNIQKQTPAVVAAIGISADYQGEGLSHLDHAIDNSLKFCHDRLTLIDMATFRDAVGEISHKESSHDDDVYYIDFGGGAFFHIPIIEGSADVIDSFDFNGKIVLLSSGEVEQSGFNTRYMNDHEIALPFKMQSSSSAGEAHVAALVLYSFLNDRFIREVKTSQHVLIYMIIGIAYVLVLNMLLRRTLRPVASYLANKALQLGFLIVVVGILLVYASKFHVFNIKPSLGFVVVGGEILFWLLFLILRSQHASIAKYNV